MDLQQLVAKLESFENVDGEFSICQCAQWIITYETEIRLDERKKTIAERTKIDEAIERMI